MNEELKKININFEKQIELVTKLIEFDKLILDFCLRHMETLNDRLKNGEATKITNQYYLADNAINALNGIKTNQSFTKNYSNIYNQCLVLLVSHFTLTVEEIFATILKNQFSNNKLSKNAKNQIQLTLDEIDDVNQNPNLLKKLLVTKKKLSFQNMNNIVKSFENFLGIKIDGDPKLDDIKFGFECRHLIVHNLSISDEKFIKNCKALKMRNIKKKILENDTINYSKSELEFIKISMLLFIQELIEKLTK
jgi:hypothetical protein